MKTNAEFLMEAIEGNHQISVGSNWINIWWNNISSGLQIKINNADKYYKTVMMAYRIK